MFYFSIFVVFTSVVLKQGDTSDEFLSFKNIVKKNYLNRKSPQLRSLGRQADPCRVQTISGRRGGLPNSGTRFITQLQLQADSFNNTKKLNLKDGETLRNACIEALKYVTLHRVKIRICGEALAHYRKRAASDIGRVSSGSAWDDLYTDLSQVLSEDDILIGLDLYGYQTLGLMVDNTGSMSDDIDRVTEIIENFVDASDNYDIDNFVIMSYGDPYYEEPTSYYDPEQAKEHLENKVVASMGGDCPEMVCTALEELVSYSNFNPGSPIFVFTDASSKDCEESVVETLEDIGREFDNPFHFILTGTCDNKIDANYTRLALNTSGSIYRIDESHIFDMKNIIAESVEPSTLIQSGNSDEVEGYGRKKRSGVTSLAIYVDETVGKLTLEVTFSDIVDPRDLNAVSFEPKFCSDENDKGKRFGNLVYYHIDCPCMGEWTLTIPKSINKKWSFLARTYGEHSISFDVQFEQVSRSGQHKELITDPCAGDLTKILVTVYQYESIDTNRAIILFFDAEGEPHEKRYRLEKQTDKESSWSADVIVPNNQFIVAIRGKTKEGNFFLRLLNTKVRPLSTCLKTERIAHHATVKPGGETMIVMSLNNKKESKRYDVYCLIIRGENGFVANIKRPSSRSLDVRENRNYYIYIQVKAPPTVTRGNVVSVKCYARSGHEKVHRTFSLSVSSLYAA